MPTITRNNQEQIIGGIGPHAAADPTRAEQTNSSRPKRPSDKALACIRWAKRLARQDKTAADRDRSTRGGENLVGGGKTLTRDVFSVGTRDMTFSGNNGVPRAFGPWSQRR